ncbi:PEGA domain-containing protein [uncultured Treponema sp.]|uniref:PEGA domain-containing protein n=1 Tax=uncultured Treponema sp. TaxID=162155 RepID=UPI0025FD19BC|nr:PEGA domain-containing protein [uncultured Treponema sp.]
MKYTKFFILGLISIASFSPAFAQNTKDYGLEQEAPGSESSEAFEYIPLLEPEEIADIDSSRTKATIKTNVKKSTIYLNGNLQGKTPLNIQNLVEGFYLLHVECKGYLPKENFIYIQRGKARTFYIELEPTEETLKKQAEKEAAAERKNKASEASEASEQSTAPASETTSTTAEDTSVGDAK